MLFKENKLKILIAASALMLVLICACSNHDTPTAKSNETQTPAPVIYELDLSETPTTDLSVLESYPQLQRLDLNGLGLSDVSSVAACTELKWLDLRGNAISTETFDSISAALPGCEILWDVPIGEMRYDCTVTELTLSDADKHELEKLTYFTFLEYVDATSVTDTQALTDIRAAMPECEFDWCVTVCGETYPADTAQLDLSGYQNGTADLLEPLSWFAGLDTVDLRGWVLTLEEMNTVADASPETRFLFSFALAGIETDSTVKELDISGQPVASTDEIHPYLRFMPELTYLDMCNCGLSNEEMAELRDSHPEIKFVWIVHMRTWSLRTDTVAFTTFAYGNYSNRLRSSDIEVLKYCTDLKALDLGHQFISDLTVIGGLTDLRVLILADNLLEDLSPLANLTELRYVELFVNENITDISPLAACTKLLDINLSVCQSIKDYSPLYGLENLERLWLNSSKVPQDTLAQLIENLPSNCVVCAKSRASTESGWRNHERYFIQVDMFSNNYIHDVFLT